MASSTSTAIEVAVFTDTSLGTHIAISISPDVTVAEFKRKFEIMHSNYHPEIGNIKVDGLMVKRKSFFYHLPESMPIKHVFRGSKGAWFLYTEAYPLNKHTSSTCQIKRVHGGFGLSEHKTKIKKKGSFVEPTSERASESISVSGIIEKYFSVYDEVTSTKSRPRVPKYAPKTPPATTTNVRTSRDEKKLSGVGKRLIVAANNLGISTSNGKPMISLSKDKCGKLSVLNSSSLVRNLVFELGEE